MAKLKPPVTPNIEFRAKSISKNAWVKGCYIRPNYIYKNGPITTVKVDTIGQYTRRVDKNGTKIYEGDIIQYYSIFNTSIVKVIDSVVFRKAMFCLKKSNTPLARCNEPITTDYLSFVTNRDNFPEIKSITDLNKWEVIGNVFDNPELLKNG